MDNKTNRSTNVGNISNSPKSLGRMSAEEKLKKSLKNLSYTSGGSTNISSTPTKTSTYGKKEERKKVGGVVLDVETIQGATKQKLETRGRRNNVFILILVLLLVISLVYLAVTMISYYKGKRDPNCKYTIQGDAGSECSWIIEGAGKTEFIIEEGLGSGLAYELNSVLNVKTIHSVSITIEIIVLLEDKPISVDIYYSGSNPETFTKLEDNTTKNIFVYNATTFSGGGKLHIFDGIDFTDAPLNLSSTNITIQVIANVNIVN